MKLSMNTGCCKNREREEALRKSMRSERMKRSQKIY